MRTTKIYDSAGNGLAKNATQRARSLAATLMENLTEQIAEPASYLELGLSA